MISVVVLLFSILDFIKLMLFKLVIMFIFFEFMLLNFLIGCDFFVSVDCVIKVFFVVRNLIFVGIILFVVSFMIFLGIIFFIGIFIYFLFCSIFELFVISFVSFLIVLWDFLFCINEIELDIVMSIKMIIIVKKLGLFFIKIIFVKKVIIVIVINIKLNGFIIDESSFLNLEFFCLDVIIFFLYVLNFNIFLLVESLF